jgi:hypothetical protein
VVLTNKKRPAAGLGTFLALALSMVAPLRVHAQVSGGTLSGTIADQSGASIPNGQVSIKNVATAITRSVTTDAAGFYTAPNLMPGTYEVTVSAPGFSTLLRTGIALTVGSQQVLNLTLQVGQMTQKVLVTGEAAQVQLSTSGIDAVVNSETVRELPLNGRSWTDLASLQPGVDAVHTQSDFTQGSNRGNRGFGAQLTISGARPQQNNYRLDGVSLNDYGNGAPGSVLGGNLGVDAIQEFSVLTTNYSAEYGKTAGGVVNAITRSGNNEFHGAVYEFLRNDVLDARNFFDPPGSIPPFRRNQFGGNAGGPIRKNQTFIFGDYEGLRQSKGHAYTDTVPSEAARTGHLSTGAVTVDPTAAKFLGLYPLPNAGLLSGGDIGIFEFAAQQVVNQNFVTTRLDQKISERDSLFGTYLYDDANYQSPDALRVTLLGSETKRQIAVLEENHVFSSALVNTARFGYNRTAVHNNSIQSAINPLAEDKSLGAIPGQNAPRTDITTITELLGGVGATTHTNYFWNSFQGYDDAFLTRGTHSLKFGVAVERMDLNMLANTNPAGRFVFSSLKNFLTNKTSRFQGNLSSATPRNMRQTLFGAYIQDDWRALPNLTLNLGLRYEMTTVPTEVHGKLSNLINYTDATAHLGDPLFLNPTLRNFEPRVGFAWDPFRNGKTAVRGGFGLFDILPLLYQSNIQVQSSQPFFLLGIVRNPPQGSFTAGAFNLLKGAPQGQTFIEHAPKRDYVMQWNLNIQRQLTPNLMAQVAYVGSRGVHLPFRVDDGDVVIPKLTPAGYLFPLNGTKINPAFGKLDSTFYINNSYYHALQVGIQNRVSRGFQVQGSFTWGKSIDTNSASVAGDQFANSVSSWWNWFDPKVSRGPADFNIGRTLVINAIWEVPGLRSAREPMRWITNGWELGGIYGASDGVPFTATMGTGGDPLGLMNNDPWDFPNQLKGCNPINRNFKNGPGGLPFYVNVNCFAVPTAPDAAFYTANCNPSIGPPQCLNLRGNSRRNSMNGPGLSNLDFSVFKNTPIPRISETFNVQFRVEIFNILNHANFLAPVLPTNTDMFDAQGNSLAPQNGGDAGLLTSTATDSREIQFGLKLIW